MIQGEFDELGQLFFEIDLIAANNDRFTINALLDTGSTEWLAVDEQDLDALGWSFYGTRQLETAQGQILLPTYLGIVSLDGQEFNIPVVAGSAFQQTLLGIPWLRTRRLVADFSGMSIGLCQGSKLAI